MQLSEIKDFLIHQFHSETDLVNTINQVAINFTSNREDLDSYLNNPKMVAAYTAFYMTTNLPKLEPVLSMVGNFADFFKDRDIVDIGCGPGTFLLGLRQKFQNQNQFWGIETSKLMREQAKKIAQGLKLERVNIVSTANEVKATSPILIFGHSINEMGAKVAYNYIKKLNPEAILIIEPGTKQAFSILMELRQLLLQSGLHMHFPCPSEHKCPMDQNDWCHQYIYVNQEDELARLGQLTKKNRNLLPLTIHAYARSEVQNNSKRLIRYIKESKHALEWQICEHNQNNQLIKLETPKRGLSKKEVKELKETYAGASVDYEVSKELGLYEYRGNLIKI